MFIGDRLKNLYTILYYVLCKIDFLYAFTLFTVFGELWHRNASVSAKSDALPNIIVIIITFDDYNRDYKVTIIAIIVRLYS